MKSPGIANSSTCWPPSVQGTPRIAFAWLMWGATALFVLFQFFYSYLQGRLLTA
ncbi:hypothetical protein [Coxiella-like endosymbiont]|uniref:hypothetical protein n=1 Tax=Coxiella-like endosymbiont TaxID=1592897 RepID=UPI0028695502|nr:hypothetical protein [Coxiella-like endosymbiont]